MAYTEANMETAMCLWEAVTELLLGKKGGEMQTLAERLIEEEGTPVARLTVIGWVLECEAEFTTAQDKGEAAEPYDWEHCPTFLERKLRERFALEA